MGIGFLIGLAVLIYPLFAGIWNNRYNLRKVDEYTNRVQEMDDDTLNTVWEAAQRYNDSLQPIVLPDSFIQAKEDYKSDTAYTSSLNIRGDGMMGYISIPKIDVEIPIYHSATDRILERGVGHLHGSSLPIGGKGCHSVLVAHRGLPGKPLFTDLDRMKEGDKFYLHVLDEVLAYEVDQIMTVEPSETDALQVDKDMDYCTLVTCTPYGVNTHRLLVRGHRVDYVEDEEVTNEKTGLTARSIYTNYAIWAAAGFIIAFAFLLIVTVLRNTASKAAEARRKKAENKEKISVKDIEYIHSPEDDDV